MNGLVETVCSLGVGAVLALVIFHMYRKDRKGSEEQMRSDRKWMQDQMKDVIDRDIYTRDENTKALVGLKGVQEGLTKAIDRLNGRN